MLEQTRPSHPSSPDDRDFPRSSLAGPYDFPPIRRARIRLTETLKRKTMAFPAQSLPVASRMERSFQGHSAHMTSDRPMRVTPISATGTPAGPMLPGVRRRPAEIHHEEIFETRGSSSIPRAFARRVPDLSMAYRAIRQLQRRIEAFA